MDFNVTVDIIPENNIEISTNGFILTDNTPNLSTDQTTSLDIQTNTADSTIAIVVEQIGATDITITDSIQGTTGIQGPLGMQGIQGLQGSIGSQGLNGIQGIQGNTGTNGSQGTQGTQGIQGNAGSNGSQGNQGIQGIQGNTGTQGSNGIQGTQGNQGTQGVTGGQGNTGSQGVQGLTGSYPSIANYTDNRILTSDGTSSGINAESLIAASGAIIQVGTTGLLLAGTALPSIQLYSAVDESAKIIFKDSTGADRFIIIRDDEDGENRINSDSPLLIVAGSGIGGGSQPVSILSSGLLYNGTQVSVSGHTHTSSNISDFNTSVSGLIDGIYAPLSGAIFTGNISAPSGNFTSLTVSGIPLINGGYDYEIHVSQIDGNDTTGNGDLLNPVASITKALTLVGSQRKTIIVHPGTYTENPSITVQYTTITGPGLIGGNILLSGTLSTNTGCTIAGIKMTNLTIATPTGAGNVNILNCEISGTLTKSSNADYTVLRLCDYGSASITGAGLVAIFGGNPNFTTVNNASANIIIKSAVTVAPVLTSGTLSLIDSIVVAAVTNAITSASSSIITLANCQMLTSALSNVAPVVLSGFYSILNCVYDKTNSTLVALSATGGSTNSIDYFQYINADKFITQGGTSSQYLKGDGSLTDFNSSVSGLLPVKNIVSGSGIDVSSSSGIFTIAVTGVASLIGESVDDRVAQLLVAGTGVYLDYNDPSGILTLNNLHTEINVLAQEPQGFVNRTDSIVSFNDSTRTFTIQPSGSKYDIYIEGVKVTKTVSESIVIGSGTALNYLHFDTNTGLLSNKTTRFDFDTDVPIAYIHWNADINQSTFFGEERHGIRMDSSTHKWIHNTFGVQYIEGLSIGNYVLLGNGSLNSHAQISISDGTLYQEDIIINIADGDNGVEFTQQLDPIAYIPTYYHSGSTGQWVRGSGTPYPVKYDATRAQYNLLSGGTWTTPNVPNNRYFAMWLVATNDMNDPILAIVGQREDSSLGSAENNNNWNDLNLVNIPANEIKPLYRLIFQTNNTYTNTPKSSLQAILDLRESVSSAVNGVTQNDHGLLFGLGDDDHNQYIHINTSRTVEANHTFTNGLTISSGLLSAASGNFTNLEVNNIPVSLEKSVIVHVNNSNISATGSSAREYVYIFSDLATNYALILPTAVNNKGIFTLKNNTTGTVYLQTSVGQTIDGYSDIGLNRQYISISVISDGSNWIIV